MCVCVCVCVCVCMYVRALARACEGARCVRVNAEENGSGHPSSNLFPLSHSTNTLCKGMNPIILSSAIVGQTGLFKLGEHNRTKRRKTLNSNQ